MGNRRLINLDSTRKGSIPIQDCQWISPKLGVFSRDEGLQFPTGQIHHRANDYGLGWLESHARPGTIPGAMILTLKVIKVWEFGRICHDLWKLHKNQHRRWGFGWFPLLNTSFLHWLTLTHFEIVTFWCYFPIARASCKAHVWKHTNFHNVLFQWWSTWNELITEQKQGFSWTSLAWSFM